MFTLKQIAASFTAAAITFCPLLGGEAASLIKAAQKNDVTGAFGKMERWRCSMRDEGGTLLFSDSPEYVKEDGILYQDTVVGKARILFYHLNDSPTDKKVSVLLTREDFSPAKVTITRGGSAKPGRDFLRVGRTTQKAYFADERHEELLLKEGQAQLLQQDMAKKILRPGDLVYGVYDFETNRPVKVTVLIHDAAVETERFVKTAKILPKDEHKLRGTFKGMNRVITAVKSYDAARDGLVYLPIGDEKNDLFKDGIDATDGERTVNYGNYGVLYQLKFPVAEKSSLKLGLTPIGGVYSGAVKVFDEGESRKGKVIMTPRYGGYFGDKTMPYEAQNIIGQNTEDDKAVLTKYHELTSLGTYRGTKELFIEYSPPGASNLPAWLILAPG